MNLNLYPLKDKWEGVRGVAGGGEGENKHMLIWAASVEHAEATPRRPEEEL